MQQREIARTAALLTSLLTGCVAGKNLPTEHRVEHQHEAAAVHFAVLAAAPWDEYARALQPQFPITSEDALADVVPTTQALQRTVTSLVQSAVGLGRASGTSEAGVDPPQAGSDVFLEGPEGPLYHVPTVLAEPIEVDPMLRHWAATALYQEVQLLNRFVQDAAVRRGFDPYVVRIQISLMPLARNEPYDSYSTLSFFSKSGAADASALVASSDSGAPAVLARGDPGDWRTPQILPLMVTDNLEASLQSRVMDDIRQMAASLLYLSGSGSASADIQSVQRDLESLFGRDVNSLLTVARQTDNTLCVRLGALAQGSTRLAMVPRTHNVTILLMVPRESPGTLQVICRSKLVDAHTGQALANRPPALVAEELRGIAASYGLEGLDAESLERLQGRALQNDQPGYFAALEAELGDDAASFPYARALWVDLVSALSGGQYSSTEFDLPRDEASGSALPRDQLVRVSDDGLESAEALVQEVDPAAAPSLIATLHLRLGARRVPILAEELRYDASVRELRASFPSLAAWGLVETAPEPGDITLELRTPAESRTYEAIWRLP